MKKQAGLIFYRKSIWKVTLPPFLIKILCFFGRGSFVDAQARFHYADELLAHEEKEEGKKE